MIATIDRRVLRFAIAHALALAIAYGLAFPLPYLTPLFVTFLAMAPGPPPSLKGLTILLLVALASLTVGVLLIPLLRYYPLTAVLLVALGVFGSMYLTLILGKPLPGIFLTVGFTLISVAGSVDYLLATTVITSLALAIATAVFSLWLVYPFFPEPALAVASAAEHTNEGTDEHKPGTATEPVSLPASSSNWLAIRAMLIIMPAYLLALTNPAQYLMTIMKSVSLGQQATLVDARHAGKELLGSTFAGGLLAVLFWTLLSLAPTLWMFSLWMFAAALFVGAKIFGVLRTSLAPSFWVNALVTMVILLGPAVQDSANGKSATAAFAVRFCTFIGVTLYAWAAIALLEKWRRRRQRLRLASLRA